MGGVESTVWMVPLRRKDVREYKGTISLGREELIFTERKSGDEYLIPLGSIRRAKRLRGSPVLMVRHGEESLETAFYFAQPPPLRSRDDPHGREDDATRIANPFATMLRSTTGGRSHRPARERRTNAQYLTSASSSLREQIDEWVHAIDDARRQET